MPRHFRVHELLGRDELDELEAFVRERPACTVDQVHEWVLARGHVLGRSAAHTWKREFDATDRFRASNETARALVDAANAGGTVAIGDAASLQLGQMLFEQMLRMQTEGEVETKELWAASMALKNVIASKRGVERLKTEVAAALAEAEREAKAGGSADAVVAKVRGILGIKEAA